MTSIPSRVYSEKNLDKVKACISSIDFIIIDKFPNIEDKWVFVKDSVIEAIEKCCPEKTFKPRQKNHCPWFDDELRAAKKYRDYCFYSYSGSKNEQTQADYKEARRLTKVINFELK